MILNEPMPKSAYLKNAISIKIYRLLVAVLETPGNPGVSFILMYNYCINIIMDSEYQNPWLPNRKDFLKI